VLSCTGVLVVGVTSFREREQIPNLLGGVLVWVLGHRGVFSTRVCFDQGPSWCGPCLPFYSFQREGLGYIYGKKVKIWKGKGWKKKQKGGLRCGRLRSYPVWAIYPVAQRRDGRWTFGLSVRWCNALWPCFVLCAFVPSRMSGVCARIYVERELGSIVVVTLVAVEAWTSS
jgi:hypothetical protein